MKQVPCSQGLLIVMALFYFILYRNAILKEIKYRRFNSKCQEFVYVKIIIGLVILSWGVLSVREKMDFQKNKRYSVGVDGVKKSLIDYMVDPDVLVGLHNKKIFTFEYWL